MTTSLAQRAENVCEICGATEGLSALDVPHTPTSVEGDDAQLWCCPVCAAQITGAADLDATHLMALQGAAWSAVPAVQVVAWRLLGQLEASWAADLRDQMWLEPEVQAWAEMAADAGPAVVDCNGTPLADGDSVTLIKDLVVKGANFTAKRGTMVKGIRLGSDPTHVEGRVNKTAIYLKTEFLKKA